MIKGKLRGRLCGKCRRGGFYGLSPTASVYFCVVPLPFGYIIFPYPCGIRMLIGEFYCSLSAHIQGWLQLALYRNCCSILYGNPPHHNAMGGLGDNANGYP